MNGTRRSPTVYATDGRRCVRRFVKKKKMMFYHNVLIILWSLLLATNGTLIKPRVYEIRGVNSTCTSQTMKIRIELNRNFQGVVYAKGFPLEKHCRNLGTGDSFVEISVDTSGCGVRLVSIDDEKFTFRISLNIQTDKYLQQINDLEISATCSLSFNDMVYPRQVVYNRQLSRTGRNKLPDTDRQDEVVNGIKTWMEIKGTSESSNTNKVSVGEQTIVLIKSFLPENVAADVVDCYAYDGTRDVAQKLIDENGCPVDETIMPSLEPIRYEDEDFSDENEITWDAGTDASIKKSNLKKAKPFSTSNKAEQKESSGSENTEVIPEKKSKEETKFQVMGTIFSAFKFPDTSNLHLRCSLQICRKACLPVSCNSNLGSVQERTGKSVKSNKNQSTVIDKIEVFNSVEVVAPGIDSDGYSLNQDGVDSRIKTNGSNFCLSASKMAFSFAILGAVFLCGVIAALWTVMRNQLRKANKIDGSEQILVVRDSPMNFTNFRNTEDDFNSVFLPAYHKRMELKRNLEKIANLNQRLFKISQRHNETRTPEDQIWPCIPRKKPYLVNERILDLPEFNRGFHLSNTIDWGPKDIIVTSVMNRIVIGSGFSGKHIETETITEYENDIGTAVSWSGDGAYIAVGTETGTVQIWDMTKRKLIMEEKCCEEQNCIVTGVQWHPMQHSLAWACSAGKISRRDFRDNVTTEVEVAHDGCICNLKYSPKANYLCSSGQDGYVRIWRGDSCEPYMEIEMSNPVRAIAWHPWRSGLLAVGDGHPASGSLSIWNVNTTKMQYMGKPSKPVAIKALEFNKISGELICSQWVYSNEKEQCEIVVLGGSDYVVDFTTEKSGCVTSLLWNPDGTKLGTAGSDETFKIWKFLKPQNLVSRRQLQKNNYLAFNQCHYTVR